MTMAKKKYNLGMIGCGKIWEIGHWPGLKELTDEAVVRYVYDTAPALAAKAAALRSSGPASVMAPIFPCWIRA